MGTDIHGVWQTKIDGVWKDVPSNYDEGRHYRLFSVLAGIRNGRGFAGTVYGESVVPISEPRGLPSDFEVVTGADNDTVHPIASREIMAPWRREWSNISDPLEIWMGYHDHSWLTSTELLAWYDAAPTVNATGYISREQYLEWDGSAPEFYCGDTWGPQVFKETVHQPGVGIAKDTTHVQVTWKSDLREDLGYFFHEVRRLHDLHGEVRFVFGFDS